MSPEEIERNRLMDKVRAKIFQGSNAAFLGPLMASLNFYWTDKVETCATDYVSIFWNPADFDKLCEDERVSSIIHELGHNYRFHGLRCGDRDHDTWNQACDIIINRDLRKSGWVANPPNFLPDYWHLGNGPEEDIYDKLMQQKANAPQSGGSPNGPNGPQGNQSGNSSGQNSGHQHPTGQCSCAQLGPVTQAQAQKAIQNVVQAVQQAQMANKPGDIPGEVEQLISTFLEPKINWEELLHRWFNGFLDNTYSYRRPNRRYAPQGILMRSRFPDKHRLDNLIYAFDVSGSVSDNMVIRFNSEVKHIRDTYQPKKITLILFDTKIQRVIEVDENDDFDQLKVVGRGGTHLECVRQFIMDNEATAAIIFTDLFCEPMAPGPEIPILWIAVNNPQGTVPFGEILHIEESY